MSRIAFCLVSDRIKARAIEAIRSAPPGARVEIKAPKRTLPQNDRMWAMLTDLSQQLAWHGQRLTADDWKVVLLAGLKQEMRLVPNINGNGFVQLGRSSSDLSVEEMSQLMDLIEAFGAQHGVEFHAPERTDT